MWKFADPSLLRPSCLKLSGILPARSAPEGAVCIIGTACYQGEEGPGGGPGFSLTAE